MVKVYFDDGTKKKVEVDTFIKWVNNCQLELAENDIYYGGEHFAKYFVLSDNKFGVLDSILCLVLMTLIMLALVKGGLIL